MTSPNLSNFHGQQHVAEPEIGNAYDESLPGPLDATIVFAHDVYWMM